MNKGYVYVCIRVDGGDQKIFINDKSLQRANRAGIPMKEIIEDARELTNNEPVKLKCRSRCTIDVVYGKNNVRSLNKEGEHEICITANRVTVK